MATDLDRRMDAGIAQLTSAEGTLPLTDIALDGRRLPMIASAPPALPHYFAHYCREHADATFLVAGYERIAFAEIPAEAERGATALVAGFGIANGASRRIALRSRERRAGEGGVRPFGIGRERCHSQKKSDNSY